jgi:hypothetical protein
MRRAAVHLAIIVTLAACGGETRDAASTSSTTGADSAPVAPRGQATGPEPRPDLITPDGWGPLRIGMSGAEVVAAAGEDANPDAVGGPDPERCDEFRPARAPAGILVMV